MRNSHNLRRALLVATGFTALTAALPMSALAADLAADASAPAGPEVDQVIVTGSRASGRTVENAVAPIDVLSGESIEKANKANLLEQLGSTLPSFFVANSSNNVSNMIRAGQLRGQNPGHTLVLVNGKRFHSTAFLGAGGFSATAPTDLSVIPNASIKRIEVLRDGASALYGSDAIAGVINIITEDGAEGGQYSLRYGKFTAGDGQTEIVQLSQGFQFGAGGHLRLTGQYDDQKIVIRNSPVNPNLLFYFPISTVTGKEVVPAGVLNTYPTPPANAVPNPKEATRNNNAWINVGKAPYTLKSFAADIGHPIGETAEAYGYFTFAQRNAEAPQNFRTPNRDETVRAIYPDGYTPVEQIDETDYSALIGVKGRGLFGWDWDGSSSYGRDKVDLYVTNSLNASWGLASPTSFYLGTNDYEAWTNNFDLRRSLNLWSIPTDLSVGVEHRYEHFTLSAGDVASYTWGVPGVNSDANPPRVLDGPRVGQIIARSLGVSQALPGYSPADAQDIDRTGRSVYFGAALNLTPQWTLDLATRYEDFSDFGSQATWRASSRYQLNDNFAVRGTISTGFHAPALAALSYRSTGNANTSTNYVLSVNSPEAQALGAKPLQPETAKNYSIGVVAEPFWRIKLAVDLYRIDVESRITQIANFNTTARPLGPTTGSPSLSEQLTNGRILRGDGISYLVNSSDTRTDGLEVTVDRRFTLENDTFTVGYAANFNKLKLQKIYDASPVLKTYGITLLDSSAAINLVNSVPKSKHIISLGWQRGPFDVSLRQSYWGELRRSGTVSVPPTTGPYAGVTSFDYDIGGLWTTDLNVSVDIKDNVKLTISGNNIFEVLPTRTPEPLLAAQAIYGYQNNGGIGPEGAFWSATLRYQY